MCMWTGRRVEPPPLTPAMSDAGSSITLILYSLDPGWMTGTEPFLNLVAAAAQRSSFTHVELAIVRCLRAQTV